MNKSIRDKDFNQISIYGPFASALGYIIRVGNKKMNSVLQRKFKTYRGALLKQSEVEEYVLGSTVVLRGFISTSLQKRIA